MNLGIATYIGNRLSKFWEMDMDGSDCAWAAVLCMRVSLDVNLPLKGALKIRTTLGDAHMGQKLYGPWPQAPLPTHSNTTSTKTTSGLKGIASPADGKRRGSIFGCFGASSWTKEPAATGRIREEWEEDLCLRLDQNGRGLKWKANNPMDSDDAVVEGPPTMVAEWQFMMGKKGICNMIPNDIDQSEVVPFTFQEQVQDQELQVAHSGVQNQVDLESDLIQVPLLFAARGLMEHRRRKRACYENLSLELSRLGAPWTVQKLRERIRLHDPGLVFLSETKSKYLVEKARLCMGDFNEILNRHEKQGTTARAPWQIQAFGECLSDCNIHDLGCCGSLFTWCNRREPPRMVRERLDRACNNTEWSSLFPAVEVCHIHEPCSDHAAVLLNSKGAARREIIPKRHRFRFEATWLR
ncbi:UNVERIFIED_CONTAM: hypothetical protein Sindi_1634700 [Sesamum indicum]